MKLKAIITVSVVLTLVSATVIVWSGDPGGIKTQTFLALDRWDRSQESRPAPPHVRRRKVEIKMLPNGHRWWPGLPDCGDVFPECCSWPPAKLEAMLDRNPDCETAYIAAIFAYRHQKRWPDFWRLVREMEYGWPGHHFPAMLRREGHKLHIPPPTE